MGKRKAPIPTTSSKTKTTSKARTPPFPSYPIWSTAKFWGFVRSGLRSTYNKWPAKWDVLKAAKRAYTGKGKQQKWEFQCCKCERWNKQKDVSIDHIVPAGALNSFEDLPKFVERLFVGPEGLQVLCTVCHNSKTQEERAEAQAAKDS